MFTRDMLLRYSMHGPPPDIRWADFHDYEHTRFAIGSPWVVAGVKFATDGRIAIAALTDEPDTAPVLSLAGTVHERTLSFPPVGKLFFETITTFTAWQPYPAVDLARSVSSYGSNDCPQCRGLGHLEFVACSECPLSEDWDANECRACRGEGIVGSGPLCPTCGGDRTREFPGLQLLPSGGVIANHYDFRIRRLGVPLECYSTKRWVMFRGPKLLGMLMTLAIEPTEMVRVEN